MYQRLAFFLLILTPIWSMANSIDSLKHSLDNDELSPLKYAQTLNSLCKEISWDEPDFTIASVNNFLDKYSNEIHDSIKIDLLYSAARSQRAKGNFPIAINEFKVAYSLSQDSDYKLGSAKCAYQIGILSLFIGKMEQSLDFLSTAKELYTKYGTSGDVADMHNALASYYSDNNNKQKALDNYHSAINLYEENKDTLGMANVHCNLGMMFIEEKSFEKAEFHLLEQGRLDTLLKTEWGLGFHYDFMGYLRENENKLNEAEEWYRRSFNTRSKLDSHYNICESSISLGKVLYKLSRYEEALKYLNIVLDYKESHQSLSQEQAAHEYISKCYEKKGNMVKALNHFKIYKNVSDSIYNKEKLDAIAEKEVQLDKAELDNQIVLLNKDNEIKALSLKQKSMTTLISLFALGIISILSLYILKMNRKLKIHNQKITEALKEKDFLLREIHHRVKNNLQVISSLLSLQARQIKDQNIKQVIDEGRNRVRSMALIHQNLYQEENLTGINVKTYLDKLVGELFDTYKISKDKVSLDLNINSLDLDVDTMIPLGLIINELVSNSLKHAFNEKEKGKIFISLSEQNGELDLTVSDDGKGVDVEKMYKSKSFGNRLIKAFGQKLKADLIIKSENGTIVNMKIKNYKKAS